MTYVMSLTCRRGFEPRFARLWSKAGVISVLCTDPARCTIRRLTPLQWEVWQPENAPVGAPRTPFTRHLPQARPCRPINPTPRLTPHAIFNPHRIVDTHQCRRQARVRALRRIERPRERRRSERTIRCPPARGARRPLTAMRRRRGPPRSVPRSPSMPPRPALP